VREAGVSREKPAGIGTPGAVILRAAVWRRRQNLGRMQAGEILPGFSLEGALRMTSRSSLEGALRMTSRPSFEGAVRMTSEHGGHRARRLADRGIFVN
jgi:hypothetical protein